MKNKTVKFTSTIIISVLAITGFIISYNKINKEMPGYTYHYYNTDEAINFDDIQVTVSDAKRYSDDKYWNIYNLEKEEDCEYKITVNMKITNDTDSTKSFDLSRVLIEKKGWFSNLSLYDFYSINKLESYIVEIQPNSSKDLIVPFTYYYYYYYPGMQDSLDKIEFWLDVYNTYPDKNIIKI